MGKANVLVVEDNADNMALVRFLLERAGYDVLHAWDGPEGIRQAKELKPDLILMDIAIPEIDGVDATKVIRADPETAAIPIIALTARTLAYDRRRAMEAGCDGFISKPINVVAFIKEVDNFIAQRVKK